MSETTRRAGAALLLCGALILLASCDDYPRDPDGTLDRVRGGVLRAGLVENPPWAFRTGEESGGLEVRLVESLARSLDAKVEWSDASGPRAFREIEAGRLDILVGGLTEDDPWVAKLGVTRPYLPGKHVVAVPAGENAWLIAVDRFFSESGPRVAAAEQERRP